MSTRCRRQVPDRFWEKVTGNTVEECWLWRACLDGSGYGQFFDGQRRVQAHRWSYTYLIADIPDGLYLDHLCRTRACVNPWHMEPVTHAENVRRGERPHRSHCPQGHPYSEDNTYRAKRGDRQCRACMRARNYRQWKRLQSTAAQLNLTIRQARKEIT